MALVASARASRLFFSNPPDHPGLSRVMPGSVAFRQPPSPGGAPAPIIPRDGRGSLMKTLDLGYEIVYLSRDHC